RGRRAAVGRRSLDRLRVGRLRPVRGVRAAPWRTGSAVARLDAGRELSGVAPRREGTLLSRRQQDDGGGGDDQVRRGHPLCSSAAFLSAVTLPRLDPSPIPPP